MPARRYMQVMAAAGVVLAVGPILLGADGAVAGITHVSGGTLALTALVVEGLRLTGRMRLLAFTGIAISIVVIAVVTGGGSLANAAQVAVLVALGTIYVGVVFWPHDTA